MENIGMFNKVRKFIVRENAVDGQCCAQQPPTSAIWKTLFSIWIRCNCRWTLISLPKGEATSTMGGRGKAPASGPCWSSDGSCEAQTWGLQGHRQSWPKSESGRSPRQYVEKQCERKNNHNRYNDQGKRTTLTASEKATITVAVI